MYVSAGSNNVGDISIYDNTETYELLRIDAGEAVAHAALYTVPANSVFYLAQWHGSEVSNQETHFGLWARTEGSIWRLKTKLVTTSNMFHIPFQIPLRFPEKTDVALRVYAGSSATVTGGFEGFCERIN